MDDHVLQLLAEQSVKPQKLWQAEEEQPTELLANVGHFMSPRCQDDFCLPDTFFNVLRGELTGQSGAYVALVDVLDVAELSQFDVELQQLVGHLGRGEETESLILTAHVHVYTMY